MDLEAVVLRCLEKTPAQRFRDAISLAQALEQCQCAGKWDQAEAASWWRDHRTMPAGARLAAVQPTASMIGQK